MWKTIALAIVVASASVLGGCTTTVAGKPMPADPTGTAAGSAPQSGGSWAKQLATEFAKLREIDPCTLLDSEVIASVSGATPGKPRPGQELSQCRVDTDVDESTSGWGFSVDVGMLYDTKKTQARHETISSEQFYVTSNDGSCTFTRMITDIVAVELQVLEPISQAGDDPCEIGTSYLTQAMKSFTDMGRREQQRTEPELPLATHDPCEAVSEVAQALKTTATGVPVKTYFCAVDPPDSEEDSPLAGKNVSITYEFDDDPRDGVLDDTGEPPPPGTEGLGTLTAVTIAGHSGSQFDGGELGCGVDLVLDDQPSLEHGTITMVQVVSVLSNDCEVTNKVAAAVMTKLDNT